MSTEIRKLNKEGVDFYPLTHEDAVVGNDGRTLGQKIATVDYDISANHNGATYADLATALGTNGANVPATVRRGGMSVRFINSDGKYDQWRYMGTSIADADFTNVANWQGVDDEPVVGSDNLVKSEGVWKAESLCIVGNTINLLSPNSNTHVLMSDVGETGSKHNTYESWGPISVVSDHSYRLYKKNMTTGFSDLNAKVYDNGSFIQKFNEGQVIAIPSNLTSPRVYLTNYKGASAYNFNECMFVDVTDTVPTAFVPYYFDDYLASNIEELNKSNYLWGFCQSFDNRYNFEITQSGNNYTVKTLPGRIFITSKYVTQNKNLIDITINSEQTTTKEILDSRTLVYLCFSVNDGKAYILRTSNLNASTDESLVIIGLGSLGNDGRNFISFCTGLKIGNYIYDRNQKSIMDSIGSINTAISTLTSDVATLKELAIQKKTERTANIFNYQSPDIETGGYYNDNKVWTSNSDFDCLPIPLEAGKTYNRYIRTHLSKWGATNIRVFDGDTMIVKTDKTSIDVPNNAVNPIGYFVYYSESSEHYQDTSNFMVVEDSVVVTEYLPYYIYSIEDETLIDLIEQIADEAAKSVEIELVQTTGAAANKAMSQAATTNAITNAVAGLSSTTVEQGKGQSTMNPMSQKAVTDLLAELEPENPNYRFAPRPASGYENFLVNVNCSIADDTLSTTAVQDSRDMQQDRCILSLPVNYTQNGEPVRLVICGHGTGWKCTAETTIPWAGMKTNMLLKEGYAVLGCNGTPGELNGLDLGHNCVPECYRSILAAYKYVIEKYNIKRDGVLTSGLSMGTYMTGQIALFTEIPVLAQVFYGFSGEIWKAQFTYKAAVRERMCQKFGFTGTAPTFTTNNPPSAAEKQYILDNIDKWSGYDVLLKGLTNKAILSTFNVWPASSTITDSDEAAIYNDAIVVGRPPCKFFVCDDDTTAPKRWSEYMAKMIRNGGGYAEVRHYATGGHNEWGVGDNITFTTKYGGDVTVNGSSYEGLLFLQKFDK